MAKNMLIADLSGRHLENLIEIGDAKGGPTLIRGQLSAIDHMGAGWAKLDIAVGRGQVIELKLPNTTQITNLALSD